VIDAEKIAVVTNGSNLELFSPREKDPDLVRNLKLQGKFVVGYIGTHGMAHSLDFIVTAIGKLTDQDIHFLFIGDRGHEKKGRRKRPGGWRWKTLPFWTRFPKKTCRGFFRLRMCRWRL